MYVTEDRHSRMAEELSSDTTLKSSASKSPSLTV